MAITIAELRARLSADISEYEAGMKKASSETKNLGEGFDLAKGASIALGVAMAGITAIGAGVGLALREIYSFSKDCLGEFQEEELSLVKLKQMYGDNAGAMRKLAEGYSEATVFTHEEIESAMSLGKMLGMTDDSIKTLIPTVMDMASSMRSADGSTMSLDQIMRIFARGTVAESIGLIRKYIPSITDAEVESIKLMSATEKAEFFVNKLGITSGMAEKETNSWWGMTKNINNAISEMKSELGGAIAEGLNPLINSLRNWVKSDQAKQLITDLSSKIRDMGKELKKVADDPKFQQMLKDVINKIVELAPKVVDLGVKMFQWLGKNWQTISEIFTTGWAIIKVIFQGLKLNVDLIIEAFKLFDSALTKAINSTASTLALFLKGFNAAKNDITGGLKWIGDKFGEMAGWAKVACDNIVGFFLSIPNRIASAFSELGRRIADWIRRVVAAIQDLINMIKSVASSLAGASLNATISNETGQVGIQRSTGIQGIREPSNISITFGDVSVRSEQDINAIVSKIKSALGRENDLAKKGFI